MEAEQPNFNDERGLSHDQVHPGPLDEHPLGTWIEDICGTIATNPSDATSIIKAALLNLQSSAQEKGHHFDAYCNYLQPFIDTIERTPFDASQTAAYVEMVVTGAHEHYSAALNALVSTSVKVDELFTLAQQIASMRREMVAKEKDALRFEKKRLRRSLEPIVDDRERYRREMEVLVPQQASLIAQQNRLIAGLRNGRPIPAFVDNEIAQRSADLQQRSSEAQRQKEDVDRRLSQVDVDGDEINRRSDQLQQREASLREFAETLDAIDRDRKTGPPDANGVPTNRLGTATAISKALETWDKSWHQ
ncbi:uncharacterized protein LOC62_01G000173 [Vanrija pseudolonga]|uniref:Uncharacterized protein n=1 Tax=Vanrija pseudolonga TaxID=143232 RepID=A0AAF0Y2U5_9TREE|nr:hypothetical protein LOC62_01G000173 [Vanrija pseudolonga]